MRPREPGRGGQVIDVERLEVAGIGEVPRAQQMTGRRNERHARSLGSRPRGWDLCSRAGHLRRLTGAGSGGDRALRRPSLVVAGAGGRSGPALRSVLGNGAFAGTRGGLRDFGPGIGSGIDRVSLESLGGGRRRPANWRPRGTARIDRDRDPLHCRRPLRHSRHPLQPRHVPAALLAVGCVYTYSFPGLIWLIGAAAIWTLLKFGISRLRLPAGGAVGGPAPEDALATGGGGGSPAATGPVAWRSVLYAVLLFLVLVAPEIGRMIDFHSFETFDPNGPGLGNLFGQISPFEVLGIWPSGDFRLAPGDGAVPAAAYYLGIAFALALFAYGVVQLWRRRETAILAGLGAVA